MIVNIDIGSGPLTAWHWSFLWHIAPHLAIVRSRLLQPRRGLELSTCTSQECHLAFNVSSTTEDISVQPVLSWRITVMCTASELLTFWLSCVLVTFICFIMAALCNRGAIIFLPCNFFLSIFYLFSFFSFLHVLCVLLYTVCMCRFVTRWGWPGGIEAYP